MKAKIIDENVMKLFYFIDGLLEWNDNKYKTKTKTFVGWLHSNGYYCVTVYKKNYKIHRILYQFYHNVILKETDVIDHINGIKTDNRKDNLRLCTKSQNGMNRKYTKENKLKTKNISIIYGKYFDSYDLCITKNGENVFREHYRTDKYTLEEVIKIRDEQLRIHHGDFHNLG